jgi:excisionase family DNA binding protein
MNTRIDVMDKGRDVGPNRPRFLDVKELAEMLRLKTRTIYDMVSQGRIPYRKAGDRTIFLLDEILEWTKPHKEDSH